MHRAVAGPLAATGMGGRGQSHSVEIADKTTKSGIHRIRPAISGPYYSVLALERCSLRNMGLAWLGCVTLIS
jgi:hypothetical protein